MPQIIVATVTLFNSDGSFSVPIDDFVIKRFITVFLTCLRETNSSWLILARCTGSSYESLSVADTIRWRPLSDYYPT